MSLTTEGSARPTSASAFDMLVAVLEEWRALGRKRYASGLKPALQLRDPAFSEAELGFASFRDFVAAAEARGVVAAHRLLSGQTLVLLPGEPLPPEPIEGVEDGRVRPQIEVAGGRLKPEVWATFVDWHDAHARLWDRSERRAFMFPVAPDGTPAWIQEQDRFAVVEPVGMASQLVWMDAWARTQQQPARDLLLAALVPGAAKGRFRRELAALGLSAAWREELQHRVVAHAARWAQAHDVALDELLDHRRAAPVRRVAPAPSEPPAGTPRAAPTGSQAPRPAGETEATVDVARLRALVHAAVDRMALPELLALPLRAEHFLWQ